MRKETSSKQKRLWHTFYKEELLPLAKKGRYEATVEIEKSVFKGLDVLGCDLIAVAHKDGMSATLAHSTSRAQSAVNFNFRNDKGLREAAESVQDRGREHATFCNHVL